MDWKRGPQPSAAGVVASSEALVGVIEELMNEVSALRVLACVALCDFVGATRLRLCTVEHVGFMNLSEISEDIG